MLSRISLLLTVVLISSLGHRASSADDGVPVFPRIAVKLQKQEPVRIVCLGDSVTGVYYHTGGRRAYPEMLELALRQLEPEARVEVVNAGISGNSTRNGLERLQRDVLDQHPDLVTVMFGLNDMVGVPVEEYGANLREIVERCRKAGADVLLCTPNAIFDAGDRTTSKLVSYCDAMRTVARTAQIPVCDCYGAHDEFRRRESRAWRLMMSDAIHPNMDGHKLNAIVMARSILGRTASLDRIGPPQPAIPRTLARIQAGEPVRVLAVDSTEDVIARAIRRVHPKAEVEVTAWPTAGQSLAQLESAAKGVRGKGVDLVVVSLPESVTPSTTSSDAEISSFIWILNWSLSFGHQEWDVIVLAPSVFREEVAVKDDPIEAFTRKMVAAQDLNLITRPAENRESAVEILTEWLKSQ